MHHDDKQVIYYGKDKIEFFIVRKSVKNINLKVLSNLEIRVTANKHVSTDVIRDFVADKAKWIEKSIKYFRSNSAYETNKEFISGESIKYLGKQYRLKIIKSDKSEVECKDSFIYLYTRNFDNINKKKQLFEKWEKDRAIEMFQSSFNKLYPIIKKYYNEEIKISVRKMKSRWGSCLKDKNTILLNQDLIKAPLYCIDYVILHELIHFRYRNHDDMFYSFLSAIMPDWKERKSMLDEEVVLDL